MSSPCILAFAGLRSQAKAGLRFIWPACGWALRLRTGWNSGQPGPERGVRAPRSTERLYEELRARGYRGSLRTLCGSPPGCARAPPCRRRQQLPRRRRWPAGSSPRPASSPPTTALHSPRSPAAARSSLRPAPWSATSLTCPAAAMASTSKRGPARPKAARSASCAASPEGLRKDCPAVTAGLTLPYSSGVVEGHVNCIKMIKRQMYGRAKLDLLRKRVLLAD